MEIYLNRNGTGKGENDIATIGKLSIGDVEVYTLEDDYDEKKIAGQTRIPAGRYHIKFRKEGKLNTAYSIRFKNIHKGMLELQNVPNYMYVYIHCGNTVYDTLGCILVGCINLKDQVKESEKAYRIIYPLIADELLKGEQVFINIVD